MIPDATRFAGRWPNRRLGILLLLVYLGLAIVAVTFVVLRKYGYV
ncbi:MAG: hypothetical protein AABZ16_02445 [candidate division NC10 bacterium]